MERSLLEDLNGFRPDFGLAADQELLLRAAVRYQPEVWIDFMADFAQGGVGGSRKSSEHVADMRRAVRNNGIQIHSSKTVDSALSVAAQANFVFLDGQAAIRNRLRST